MFANRGHSKPYVCTRSFNIDLDAIGPNIVPYIHYCLDRKRHPELFYRVNTYYFAFANYTGGRKHDIRDQLLDFLGGLYDFIGLSRPAYRYHCAEADFFKPFHHFIVAQFDLFKLGGASNTYVIPPVKYRL